MRAEPALNCSFCLRLVFMEEEEQEEIHYVYTASKGL